ncbi:MAG: right-handed parallel beta-helix repeat-containing protein [Actinomycetota bacterium]|nr:right-handed parallel beta-helix repeat-containing protein [Actinomycetota bacterium]
MLFFIVALFALTGSLVETPLVAHAAIQDQTIYVDNGSAAASDTNPGTQGAPLRTIGEAVHRALDARSGGVGTDIIIEPGVYREQLQIHGDASSAASISIEGIGDVVVSGSDPWREGWKRAGSTFVHQWPYDWGKAPIPDSWRFVKPLLQTKNGALIQRREIVFFKGRLLRQVLRQREMAHFPAAFYVSQSKNKLFVKLPPGGRPANGTIEIGVRPTLLDVDNMSGLTIRNLVFEHANSPLGGQAALLNNSADIQIDDSSFRLNNWRGLQISNSSNITIARSDFNQNGIGGIEGDKITNLTMNHVTASRNNWRGWWAGFTVWTVGQKFHSLRDSTFHDYRATGNKAHGLWLDFDNSNVVVDGATLKNNYGHGIFFDGDQGPITFENSTSCKNRNGVFAANSENITLTNDQIADNQVFAIYLSGLFNDPRPIKDSFTGEVRKVVSENWAIHDTELIDGHGAEFLFGTVLSTDRWRDFASTLSSGSNTWYNPVRKRPFQIVRGKGDTYTRPLVDFEGWKAETGQDRTSRYRRPGDFNSLC